MPARLFRISFSGEHAYELAVPADYGNMVARALMQAGEEFGIAPYGVEALSIMRIEKGHVAGGELNGTTTAGDLGLGKMMSTKKDYIGRMMAGARRPHRSRTGNAWSASGRSTRRTRSAPGSHLLKQDDAPSMANDQGYITSVAWSPMLEHVDRAGAARQWPRAAWRSGARSSMACATSTSCRDLRSHALRPGEQEAPCLTE